MFRRVFPRFALPLAEARRLFFDADGHPLTQPTAPLLTILEELVAHYKTGGEEFAKAAMGQVIQLDATDDDSRLLAYCMCSSSQSNASLSAAATTTHGVQFDFTGASGKVGRVETSIENDNDGASSAATASQGEESSMHLVIQVMAAYPHSPEVRERCCRCLANMCQLSNDSTHASGASGSVGSSVAERLVKNGAIEQVLGTLSMASRLSPKGQCWAALAALNLICLSGTGAARAAAAGAEETLSDFITTLLSESEESSSRGAAQGKVNEDEVVMGLTRVRCTALDAALGALTAVLGAEAPANTSSISFNYEKVSYAAVDATVRTLLFFSALLVRDGRNDGAYGASLPSRRHGTVLLEHASPLQQAAVVALLPPLHKGWLALDSICGHAPNLALVFDTLYEAANVNQESSATDGGDALEMNDATNRRYVAALTSLLEAALFLVTELEGVREAGAEELAKLQDDTRIFVLGSMEHMTSTRKDLAKVTGSMTEGNDMDASAAAGASAVYPTPAALGVTDVLANGLVSNMALATAVRVHTELDSLSSVTTSGNTLKPSLSSSSSPSSSGPSPYTTAVFTLLSKSLLVLSHLGEAGDEVATSANTVAALQAILRGAADAIRVLPDAYGTDLADLFTPTEVALKRRQQQQQDCSDASARISDSHQLLFLQQAAVIGQVYAVLWGVLRTPQGVACAVEQMVPATAQSVQECLVGRYQVALEEAKTRFEDSQKAAAATSQSGEEKPPDWVPNAAEEAVVRLIKLGADLKQNLDHVTQKASMK